MKRLRFILGAAALAAVAMTASPVINAQENGNRDENGKIVRGPYETNRFGDNWFLGIGGGVNVYLEDGYKGNIGPSLDANLGKWFTPSVGMRVGYSGLNSRFWSDQPTVLGNTLDTDEGMYAQKFGFMYFHGDFLWNISNAISGYKETRFWNFVPYVHAGFFRSDGIDESTDFSDNQFAMGAGLIHNLRLVERLDLVIDMRALVLSGSVHGGSGVSLLPSVTAGLAVDLGWPGFVRTSTVMADVELAAAEQVAAFEAAALALEIANAELATENEILKNANAGLKNQMNKMKNNQPVVQNVDIFDGMAAPAVYFEIGKATLSVDEQAHLEFIAKNILAKVEENGKVYLTVMGSADSNTGTAARNKHLSEARGKYVADMLTAKYGIAKDRLVVKSEVVKAKADPQLDRAVMISF
jgi:outer membrane protein OmpA-like peptidoglycan-associated protein